MANLVKSPWANGVSGIKRKKFEYRYFYLQDLPNDKEEKRKYQEIQQDILSEYNEVNNYLLKKKGDKRQMKTVINEELDKKKDESEKNEESLLEMEDKNKYKGYTASEKVKFWTKYFLKIENKDSIKDANERTCFSILIRSVEFYNELAGEISEIFSRSRLLEQNNLASNIDQTMLDSIADEFSKVMPQIISQISFTDLKTYNDAKKQIQKKPIRADTFSKHLKDELRLLLNKNLILRKEANKAPFLVVLVDQSGENVLYQSQKNIENINNKKIQDNLVTVFSQAISNLEGTTQYDLKSLGILNLDSKDDANLFLKKSQIFVNNNLKKFLNKSKSVIGKAANSNAYVSGLLGELSAALSFNGKMTGTAYSYIKGKSYGQSASDIKVNKKYGVNVKHYISNADSLTLYKADEWLDLNSRYINKYYSDKEIRIMRWAIENQGFLQNQINKNFNAGKILQDFTLQNIASFLRIQDNPNSTFKNYFFQLNNIIFPTSVIYELAQEWLKEGNNMFSYNSKFNKTIRFYYKNLNQAKEIIKDSGNYKQNYKIVKTINGNMAVKMNGLSINLAGLNLF